jgi:hypothetical protein
VTPRHPKHRSGQNATYVFCLLQSSRAPALGRAPDGVPGTGAVRLLPVDRDIWAVVADAPLDRFSSDQLQKELQDVEAISRHALAHATVVEFFFRKTPVIPLKLFTLFSSDDVARAKFRGRLSQLRRMLSALRGKEEWGVRIVAGEIEEASARRLASGRDYLQVKKRLLDEAAVPPPAVIRAVNGALRSLGTIAAKTRKVSFPPPGKGRPYVSGASFLVDGKRRRTWKAHIDKTTARLADEGHRLEMSGPWPPYHFVSR